ncbi:AAA family ATPase [Cyclobacterium plantarum]|uniref:AAA family ATPase n=1 Tax=Cyclobacterium plantarum TaxID=2716263 RepID=UPI003F6F745D
MLLLVMGLPGSGKSYFANKLAAETSMIYLSSDQVRMEMGLRGQYSSHDRQKVYDEMAARAQKFLEAGKSVLVDATFQSNENRLTFQEIALKMGQSFICMRVWAEEDLIEKRLSKSREESDADFWVYQKLKRNFDPIIGNYLDIQSEDGKIAGMIQKAVKYLENRNES